MNAVADMTAAVRLLTVIRVPGREGDHPTPYFPWVGWAFTAVGAAICAGAVAIHRASGIGALLAAAVTVAAWALLSGLLHWDGLADCADGMGVRGDAERKLLVMRDSTIGAFGVSAIVFVAAIQIAALATAVEGGMWWALGAPVVGRWAASMAAWHRLPARADGLGARHAGREGVVGHGVALAAVLPVLLLPFAPSAGHILVVGAAMVVGLAVPGIFTRKFGGITGDVLGATIVLTETMFLLAAAIVGGV